MESVYGGNSIEGSNPSLSAKILLFKILAEQSRIEIRNWMKVFLDCGQISIVDFKSKSTVLTHDQENTDSGVQVT